MYFQGNPDYWKKKQDKNGWEGGRWLAKRINY